MSAQVYKYACRECEWRGPVGQVLEAPNPFEPKYIIFGCPYCKSVDSMDLACEVDGCWKLASCGTATQDHYAHTCGIHRPAVNASGAP